MPNFDFTTLLDPRINEPGGPASETSDPAILAYLGQMFDAVQALAGGQVAAAGVSRLHALSTAVNAIVSGTPTPIPWTVAGGEQVGTDVVVDGVTASQIDIATDGLYAVTIKGMAQAGSGKLIDDAKLQVTFNSLGETIELGAAHPSAADDWAGLVSFTYFLPAGTHLVSTLTVVTHDASAWSIPTTCNAKIQRVG